MASIVHLRFAVAQITFAVIMLVGTVAVAGSVYRTNTTPGDTNWFTAANWSGASLPTPDDEAFIGDTTRGPAVVEVAAPDAQTGALTVGAGAAGTLKLLPLGNLSVADYLIVGQGSPGNVNQSGGSLQSPVTAVGAVDWNTDAPGSGSFVQTAGTHIVSPPEPGWASGLFVGDGTDCTGSYVLSGSDALLQTASTIVGSMGGNGTFTQTAGTHLITSSFAPLGTMLPKLDVPGLALGFGLTEDSIDEGAWVGYPATGSYSLTGGTLTITRAPVAPNAGIQAGALIWLGTAGTGTLLLGDANTTGTINETNPPQPTGSELGVGLFVRPIPYMDDSATVRGWGTVALTGTLFSNGRVIADGYGADRDLDLGSFSLVASSVGLQNTSVLQSDGTQAGWYAQNHGRLLLPASTITGEGSYTVLWGTGWLFEGGEPGSPVNSLTLLVDGLVEPPSFSIALLAPDRADVPEDTTGSILGIWDIALQSQLPDGASAELRFRYDDVLAASLGLNEDDILIYHFDGLNWEPLPTFVDTANHLVITDGVTSFSPFAVGLNITNQPAAIPEPASLTLVALGCLGLLSRRRRFTAPL